MWSAATTWERICTQTDQTAGLHRRQFGARHGYRGMTVLWEPEPILTVARLMSELVRFPDDLSIEWAAVWHAPTVDLVVAPLDTMVTFTRLGPGEYTMTGVDLYKFSIAPRTVRLLAAACDLTPFYADGREYWLKPDDGGRLVEQPYAGELDRP